MKFYKKLWFWVAVPVVVFLILAVIDSNTYKTPFIVLGDVDSSPVIGVADGVATIQESGWSTPVKLPVSDEGREDSTQITRDGRYLLFYYDPVVGGFRESASTEGREEMQEDPKIYYSKRPFTSKQVHPISKSDPFNVEAGPNISEAGDIYYTKTFIKLLPKPHVSMPIKTVINNGDIIIDMGTGLAESDPHYCDAEEELYVSTYDSENGDPDQDVVVYKNGIATTLPAPINTPNSSDFQSFLTDDCQTMYFTSTRGKRVSEFPLQVYKTERLGEFDWSEPELFISFPDDMTGGVGEFTMTRDGRQMVFLELIITEKDGQYTGQNEMYYAEKI
jgi:hypothetical protein